jgi:5'-methylthioadenosine phosphorylase
MTKAVLGIIGGSGLYDLPGLEERREDKISSPWGEPSDVLRRGRIGETEIVFLARHGAGHRLSPSSINYRANIDVLKRAGVTDLVSLSACGSFQDHLSPGLFVLIDQFIDRTFKRETSFFGEGCVAHVSMAYPVGPALQKRILKAAQAEQIMMHQGGTYLCIEGPQFGTEAEARLFKNQGCDVIGMTNMPEAKLAREAEITYASVGMVTDYDCWEPSRPPVDVPSVIRILHDNAQKAVRLVARLAADFPSLREPCPVGSERALDYAIVTAPDHRDKGLLAKLDAVAGRVL